MDWLQTFSKEAVMIHRSPMAMALLKARHTLPQLLQDSKGWTSLKIDDETPFVDRLWRPLPGGLRLSLHRIHACKEGSALYHPHPWPSAMELVRGSYRMLVGYGDGAMPPPVVLNVTLTEGATYVMEDLRAWHSVSPIGEEAFTFMVTGKPYGTGARETRKPLGELSNHQKQEMLNIFRTHFPPPMLVDG